MSVRRPRSEYLFAHRNGFDEFNTLPSQLEVDDASEAQDLAHFTINNLGQPIPSLADMKAALDAPETAASLREEIDVLKREQQELEIYLRDITADKLNADARDLYFQTDDLKYREKDDEWKDHYSRLERFQRFSTHHQTTAFYDTLERSRYEHVRKLHELQRRRVEAEQREEGMRRAREAQFPQSVAEYHAMGSRAAQLRVARFLMADASKQDQMSTQSNWAWRQTEPLIKVYYSNEEFRLEIGKLVRENESRDPRLRA